MVFFPAEEAFLPVPADGDFLPEGDAFFAAPAGADFPAAGFFPEAGEVFFPPAEGAVTAVFFFSEGERGAVSGAALAPDPAAWPARAAAGPTDARFGAAAVQ